MIYQRLKAFFLQLNKPKLLLYHLNFAIQIFANLDNLSTIHNYGVININHLEYHNNQFDQNNSEFLNEVVNLIKSKPQYFLDGSSKLPNYKQIGSPTISNNTSNGVFDFYPASIKPRLASPNQNRRVLPIQNLEAGFMKNPVPNLRQRKIRPKLGMTIKNVTPYRFYKSYE